MLDLILGRQAFGSVADRLLAANMDPNVLRPYWDYDKKSKRILPYVTINQVKDGRIVPARMVTNAPATLTKDAWKLIDTAVQRATRTPLRAFADLRAAGLTYNVPNAMGRTVIQYQTMTDFGSATMSMNGLRRSESDRPEFDIGGLPLPIVHSDFEFSLREIQESRLTGAALDTTGPENASRQAAEKVERITVGVDSSYSYAGYSIYGYTNFPGRQTQVLTRPTAVGWTPATFLAELLTMRQKLYDDLYFGPFVMYMSPDWDAYLDNEWKANSDLTFRDRVQKVRGIGDIRTLQHLSDFTVLLVTMQSDVARAVVGMDFTTLQWESHGGMQFNFKVMGILVPQFRTAPDGKCGYVHGAPTGSP